MDEGWYDKSQNREQPKRKKSCTPDPQPISAEKDTPAACEQLHESFPSIKKNCNKNSIKLSMIPCYIKNEYHLKHIHNLKQIRMQHLPSHQPKPSQES